MVFFAIVPINGWGAPPERSESFAPEVVPLAMGQTREHGELNERLRLHAAPYWCDVSFGSHEPEPLILDEDEEFMAHWGTLYKMVRVFSEEHAAREWAEKRFAKNYR